MKKYLKCPNCKEYLPQIGDEPLYSGDSVTCGLCGHIWTPISPAPKARPQEAPLVVGGGDCTETATPRKSPSPQLLAVKG